MAFITKQSSNTPCYSCSKHCMWLTFCHSSSSNSAVGDGGAGGAEVYLYTKNIRVNVIANPEFWGFSGTLISGWATYNESFYDDFDRFDEDHEAYRDCGVYAGMFPDEQRPDVIFRSVYDPDTNLTVHYNATGGIEGTGGAFLGGAEAYLIDRSGGQHYPISGDQATCSTHPPHQSFKMFPENFGWGNKINFNGSLFRNVSGGWRLSSLENCYSPSEIYKPSGYLVDCSGEEKQNILNPNNRFDKYEPTRTRGSGVSDYPEYADDCLPDGAVAGKYKGHFKNTSSIYRNTSISPFITANLSYGHFSSPVAASGLKNGMSIGIKTEESGLAFNNVYTIFDVSHSGTYTSVKFVSTSTGNHPLTPELPTGEFSFNIPSDSGHWVAFNTHDPETCCGLAAYGVSEKNKIISNPPNYHTDFRKVFNNPKNVRESNRDPNWRYTYGLLESGVAPVSSGVAVDRSYPSVSGIEYSGDVRGYPIISGSNGFVSTTGDVFISGSPLFEREKSYYGRFLETDKFDGGNRIEQSVNRGKGKNGTCYSKHATLEVFPDCYTQYDKYEHCNYGEQFAINRIPRLAFVYRGCDFHDDCSFDSSGLPLGGWKDQGSVPTGIEDLKRLLAGQEIHMFINLNDAWGGRYSTDPCPCDCEGEEPGYATPRHVTVRSPLRFPSFPNFDLEPLKYGCADARHQIQSIINLELLNRPENSEYCDPLHTSENVCRVRQPYTTYGCMFNLCGKETNDRRNVVEAFSKLRQEKTYTNANPTGDAIEPMYWNFTAPTPAPYNINDNWGSGTKAFDDEGNPIQPFNQIAGSGYGYWGLADHYGNLVAPYFCTQPATALCCGEVGEYVDFSRTGTFQNVLGTDTGWPTDAVPFLIELEVEEGCTSCVSSSMDSGNLVLELSGLPTEFIWNQQTSYFVEYGKYGHNYCKYGKTQQDVASFGKAKIDMRPPYSCNTGFNITTCNGSGDPETNIWASYTGNTCECANGFSTTLYPKVVPSSELVLGWTSNPAGNAAGLVEITGCGDLTSSYFSVGYDEKVNGGYKIWAQFDLSCNIHTALAPAEYPDANYENDPLATIWSEGGCSHTYPAGSNDLTLQTTLWMIDVRHEDTFLRLSSYGLKRISGMNLGNGILYPPTPQNFWGNQESNYFGLCPGDFVYTWGCKPEGTYFYGEADDEGRYAGSYEICASSTPCTTCPTGEGSGEVTCICGFAAGYEGVVPHPMPLLYQLNECDCLCSTPHLLAKYSIDADSSGMTIVDDYGNDLTRAVAYWMSYDGSSPILTVQGPPAPYMGIRLKYGGGTLANWHEWSHGVNSISENVTHELYRPYLGNEYLLAGNECSQLTVDHGLNLGRVISCDTNTGCLDTGYFVGTCGVPIYSAYPSYDGYPVRKKKCNPEVAIVTKIDPVGDNFKLYIAREYHEHDRSWQEQRVVGTGDEAESVCVSVNMGAYDYDDGTHSGCGLLPYATLADIVTPVSHWPCSVHPSSGEFVNQDYQYNPLTFSTNSGSDVSVPSGSLVWNYYNLFYADGVLEPTVNHGEILDSIGFDEDSGIWKCTLPPEYLYQEVSGKRIFTTSDYNNPTNFFGIFATTGTHSCVQDLPMCGGDLWCNKLFFPRHSYKAGTLIAPFGGGRICTGSQQPVNISEWNGYYEESGNFTTLIDGALPLLLELQTRFVDYCNSDYTEEALYDIGIDDDYVIVSDYLPLMGIVHPGWRNTTDVQSCTSSVSGLVNASTHTDLSLNAGIFGPKTFYENNFDSMGYYLDAFGVTYSGGAILKQAKQSDRCLFDPFKILLDVECVTNRIARKKFKNDAPTFLQGVQEWDSRACLGVIAGESCSCSATQCKYGTKNKEGSCTLFKLTTYEASISTDASGACLCVDNTNAHWWHSDIIGSASGVESSRACIGCTEQPGPGTWVVMPCTEGKAVRLETTQSYTKLWQCNENQYLHEHPGGFIDYPEELCDCKGQYVDGLCDAKYSCVDYSTCDCNPVPSGQLQSVLPKGDPSGSGQWWITDCECDKHPQDDATGTTHCSPSLIKWTITEEA